MKGEAKVDIELEGGEQIVIIKGDEKSVCFDLHDIINNDDGWVDGFELTWAEIWEFCKEGMDEYNRKLLLRLMEKAAKAKVSHE